MSSTVVTGKAKPRGRFPHVKKVGHLIFVSGTSSRLPDNSFAGVQVDEMGSTNLDISVQTEAVINNIKDILETQGASLEHIVDITAFLVDMNDFDRYNKVYAKYFDYNGPTRTTVAVHQLPHPHLRIEIKAIAYLDPSA
ncbi:RidA family protein [Acinetobacter sp. WZC-1]|uniref:RidA family protein n=1 Tax=Acinetobacter sp. WZC-1 TaxID=3459034 RepID=UPI00403E0DCB